MVHRLAHCACYEDLERIDTAIAMDQLDKASGDSMIIPSNIQHGGFIQFAADNDDINEETLDGKHTIHATTMVVYQHQTPLVPEGIFGTVRAQA